MTGMCRRELLVGGRCGSWSPAKRGDRLDDVIEHRWGQAGVDSDPENLIHYKIGIGQLTDDPMRRLSRWPASSFLVNGASGRTAMGNPNQLGSECGVACGRMRNSPKSASPS